MATGRMASDYEVLITPEDGHWTAYHHGVRVADFCESAEEAQGEALKYFLERAHRLMRFRRNLGIDSREKVDETLKELVAELDRERDDES